MKSLIFIVFIALCSISAYAWVYGSLPVNVSETGDCNYSAANLSDNSINTWVSGINTSSKNCHYYFSYLKGDNTEGILTLHNGSHWKNWTMDPKCWDYITDKVSLTVFINRYANYWSVYYGCQEGASLWDASEVYSYIYPNITEFSIWFDYEATGNIGSGGPFTSAIAADQEMPASLGGAISSSLKAYNPQMYGILEEDLRHYFDAVTFQKFIEKNVTIIKNLLRYLFREPASLVKVK